MDSIIREAIEIELQPNSMNEESCRNLSSVIWKIVTSLYQMRADLGSTQISARCSYQGIKYALSG
jgi:hypothetical protein